MFMDLTRDVNILNKIYLNVDNELSNEDEDTILDVYRD